jgi:hypothetical protein
MQVFCDNYLDGGYHVPYAHGALASGLQLQSYETLVLSANLLSPRKHFLIRFCLGLVTLVRI